MPARWRTVAALTCCLASTPAHAAELAAAEAWGKSRLAAAVRDAEPVVERWGYPAVATVHVMALSLFVGMIAILDFRLLGVTMPGVFW